MDFHTLSRRDLQTLCKKNRIPANITNVAMADALQALKLVEGFGEIQESSKIRCATPRTTQRTVSRRAAGPTGEEPKEQQASPLPRSRRVTASAPEIDVDETPKAPNTRRNAGRAPAGPATGRGTRQTTKKDADETMSVGLRRSARVGGKSIVKMADLVKEQEEEKEEREAGGVVDQKNDVCCEVVVVENKEEERVDDKGEEQEEEKGGGDFVDQKNDLCSEEVATETKEEEKIDDKEIGEINSLKNTNDVCPRDESIAADINMEENVLNESSELEQQNPFAEELENVENSEEENAKASDSKEFNLHEFSFTAEIPEEIKEADQMKVVDEIEEQKEINDTESMGTKSSDETVQEEIEVQTDDGGFNLQEFSFTDEIHEKVDDSDVGSPNLAEAEEFVSEMKVDDETEKEEEKEINDAEDLETESSDETVQEVVMPSVEMASETNEDSPIEGLITTEITADEAVEVETITKEVGELTEDLSDLNLSSEEKIKVNESDNKENADVNAMEVGRRGREAHLKFENLNFENMSLRKLKAVYKEAVVTINNKGEEKRAALKAIDENCI